MFHRSPRAGEGRPRVEHLWIGGSNIRKLTEMQRIQFWKAIDAIRKRKLRGE